MPALVKFCHVIMGNIWAAEQLVGVKASIEDSKDRPPEELIAAAGDSMKRLHHSYPGVHTMAYTFRLEEKYFGVLQHGTTMEISKEFALEDIVDKVGSGDCFMGGLIYGLKKNHAPNAIINFAAAAAVGKMREKGDATQQSIEQVNKILEQTANTIS